MVHLAGTTTVEWEDTDGFVEGGGDKLTACWRKVDVEDRRDVVFVDHFGLVGFSHVEGVDVTVLVADTEVHWLLGVPAES